MNIYEVDFFPLFNSVPVPGLVVEFSQSTQLIKFVNKAFLDHAEVEIGHLENVEIEKLLNHLFLIDESGKHISLKEAFSIVFNEIHPLTFFILRTNAENGICRLEDSFNKLTFSNLNFKANESMCISLFFHKSISNSSEKTTAKKIESILTVKFDSSATIIDIDPDAAKFWGFIPEEVLQKSLFDFLPSENRVYTYETFLSILQKDGKISTKRAMHIGDGTLIPVEFDAIWDAENSVVIAKIRDMRVNDATDFDQAIDEHRIQGILKEGSDLIAIVDKVGDILFLSPNYEEILGDLHDKNITLSVTDFVHPKDLKHILEDFSNAIKVDKLLTKPYRFKFPDGEYHWFETTCTNAIEDPAIGGVIINTRDITESYIALNIEKLEREIFEKNALPNSTIEELVKLKIEGIESIYDHVFCSVLAVKNNRLYNISSPSLPPEYLEMVEGLEIGEKVGSCGTAAFTKKSVFVSDISTDERWAIAPHVADTYNLRACWSIPILDSTENVIATFAIYYDEIKLPSENELNVLNRSAQILRVIFENKNRSEELKLANDRFNLAAKATSDVIWDWNIIKDEIYWGSGFETAFGYAIENFSESTDSWEKYIHPDDAINVAESLESFLAGNDTIWECEYRYIKASQEIAIIKDRGFLVRDKAGKAIRLVGAMKDVSNEKKLQELLENASKLAKMGSWKLDLVNSKVLLSTISRDIVEIDSSYKATIDGVVNFAKEGSNREMLTRAMSDAIMKGLDWDLEMEIITSKGNHRWVRTMGKPEFSNGNCVKLYGNISDIHERKLAEIELLDFKKQLEIRAQQLQVSNEELQQFAYVASHDLQEPLRMVTSFLTLLEKKYGNNLDEKATQYINFAVDGAQRMRHIILDLLEYSRVGSIDEQKKQLDLKMLVEEIIILHRKQIQELGATFTIDPLPAIEQFETPIRQVFQNLISNALKYHSVEVPPQIIIGVKENEKFHEFFVSDNGIGIDGQFKDKIFQIFQRLHNKDKYSGTGVGLAICKKVMDSMNGEIWLDTSYTKGAKFCFKIPKY